MTYSHRGGSEARSSWFAGAPRRRDERTRLVEPHGLGRDLDDLVVLHVRDHLLDVDRARRRELRCARVLFGESTGAEVDGPGRRSTARGGSRRHGAEIDGTARKSMARGGSRRHGAEVDGVIMMVMPSLTAASPTFRYLVPVSNVPLSNVPLSNVPLSNVPLSPWRLMRPLTTMISGIWRH